MIKEIYTRSLKDPNVDPFKLEHSDPIEEIIQKIKIILSTNKGDVLGDYRLGCNIEDLVFKTRNDAKMLESEINSQIDDYIQPTANYKVNAVVKFGRGKDGSDFALIDVFVNQEKVTSVLVG